MIDLSKVYSRHYLESIAMDWYNDVVEFLTEKHEGRNQLYRQEQGRRVSFCTQLEKGLHIVQNNEQYKNLTDEERTYIDNIFTDLINEPHKYIAANEERLNAVYEELRTDHKYAVGIIKEVFVGWYLDFTGQDDNSYRSLNRLSVNTCPYCNRNYTVTIVRTKDKAFKTRPEFDHFYDKSSYPSLALSFFNLIPSCHTCNHGKLTGEARINPFFRGFHSKFYITSYKDNLDVKQRDYHPLNINDVLKVKDADDFSLAIPYADISEEKNIELFGLDKLYNKHKDYVLEMVDKANAYNSIGAQNLIDAFQGIGRTPQDVFNFVWGKNLEEAENINRPFSKLTRDVLAQLGIKKE